MRVASRSRVRAGSLRTAVARTTVQRGAPPLTHPSGPADLAGMRRHRLLVIPALGLALVPASASARPVARTQQQTFPVASRLCARADAGTLPKRLAASSDQVKAACADLTSAFTAAQTDFTTATSPLAQQGSDAITTAKQTCQTAIANHDHASCRQAIAAARATLKGLRDQLRTATKTYRTAIQSARKTFWTTIHALHGGAGLQADGTTSTVAPAGPAIPADTGV